MTAPTVTEMVRKRPVTVETDPFIDGRMVETVGYGPREWQVAQLSGETSLHNAGVELHTLQANEPKNLGEQALVGSVE